MRRFSGVTAVFLLVGLLAGAWVNAANSAVDAPDWASPSAIAVKRIGDLSGVQNETFAFNNVDCTPLSYRTVGSNNLQTGCFTDTALGPFNEDGESVIFNGSDESLPLRPYIGSQILLPWPEAGVLVELNAAPVDGFYVGLYENPLGEMKEDRNAFGQLTDKYMTRPPDAQLLGPDGHPLVINPQTLAFSDGGSWLVAEDLNGSFVRINLATLDELPFAPSIAISGNPALLKSQVAISHDGRYVAINNDTVGSFKVYDLTSCDGQTVTSLAPLNCKSYDYRFVLAQNVTGLQSVRHVRFVNDGLLSFEATSSITDKSGIYELAPTASINSFISYLGLGDSYTSGEGAFDYLSGTDTGDDVCHLSANSYPLLLTHALFGSTGGHSVACSGAEINDVGSLDDAYRGQVRGVSNWQQLQQEPDLLSSVMGNFLPGYVAQRRFVQQYQPAVTTVSVGGNDVGFGNILQECVEPKISLQPSDAACFDTYEQRLELESLINRTVPRWVQLYRGLLADAPGTRLYAIGYPQIVSDTGSCGLDVHLSQGELEFTEEITDYLDGDIRQAAAQAGVTYVDISQALVGHRLCEAASSGIAVNGLTAGRDAGLFGIDFLGRESYHPNALGQQLIEQAILKQTHNFAGLPSADTSPPDGSRLLQAPKTGDTVYSLVPQPPMTAPATAGQGVAVSITGRDVGLEPNSTYIVHLDGPNGPQLGVLGSDGLGNVSGTVTMPSGTTPGGHTIDVTGSNQAGEPVDVNQPVYTPAGGGDSDGDGIPDGSDSCPYARNSATDNDQDGIDDSCDPIIGSAASGNIGTPTSASLSNSQAKLDSATVSAMANFPVPTNQTISQILGAATVNPTKTTAQHINLPVARKSTHAYAKPSLPSLRWLPWLRLLVISWLLLVLIYVGLKQLERRENKYQNGRLSTTMSL